MDGLCISHSNQQARRHLSRHNHGRDKVLVWGERVEAEEEGEEGGKQTSDLCRGAQASPLDSEEDNNLLCLVAVDIPPPPEAPSACFLIPERECAFLRERKTLSLKSQDLEQKLPKLQT